MLCTVWSHPCINLDFRKKIGASLVTVVVKNPPASAGGKNCSLEINC